MKWVLILVMISYNGNGVGVTTTEFSSEKSCQNAVEQIIFNLDDAGIEVYSVCVFK